MKFSAKKGKQKQHYVEVQICPKCFSPDISQLSASSGDITGALAILPPKYLCRKCNWVGRLVIIGKVKIAEDNSD